MADPRDEFWAALREVNSQSEEASRRAAWAAFDLAVAEADPLKAREVAETLCVDIAQPRQDHSPQPLAHSD